MLGGTANDEDIIEGFHDCSPLLCGVIEANIKAWFDLPALIANDKAQVETGKSAIF
jgi:hypothetical protein